MANTTIPNLPAAVSVDGNEQLEAVQNGTSVRLTASQIASLAQNTQGTVTQINTAGALIGGPITTTGTISLPPDAITNQYLAEMPADTLKANLTGLTANPTDVTPSQLLDTFGNSAGEILYRDAGVWAALAPGSSGFYLTTTGNQPQWTALSVSPADIQPSGVSPGTYGTASEVAQFTVAASGQITGANNVAISIPAGQVTGLGTMAVQNANNVTITGGTMNGVTIGSVSPSQAYFTTISGGVWNGSTIAIQYGGTGATTAATARTNLGLGTMAVQDASNVAITGGVMNGVTIGASNPQAGTFTTLASTGNVSFGTITAGTWNGSTIAIQYGGTAATDAAGARLNLSAAASGANSDITSLSGLTTPLSAPQGGTGFASYTTGDLLYASSSSSLGRLNDVATGNVLRSGGVGVAPAWGKLNLTTDITGVLTVPNGGTGAATLTGYVYGNGTSAMTASPIIPIADLQYNGITIGSTPITLGSIALTLSGLTSVTLTQDPTLALQATTKQYVDGVVATVSNQTFHTQVVASTTANLNAAYSNGSSGVGATLTNSGTKAQFQTDNVIPDPNARILVKNQTNAYENGIYTLTTVGSADPGGTNWVLTRATDFNTVGAGPNFIQTGAAVFVDQGDTWGSTSWVMNTIGAISVGSTDLNWAQTSSAGAIVVTSPLQKSGNIISLGTVPATLGGTGLTSYTVGDLLYANTSTSLAKLADVATGNVLRSGGVGVAPSWGKLDLTTDVTGTLPVANGGSGTSTAFTAGSVLFAGASGVYSQDNSKFFYDDVNNRLGLNTTAPTTVLTIVSPTQTALPPGSLPSGTDLHVVGADSAETRITQDSFGTGNYSAYTGRHARGTAATPTATQAGDILSQYTGRGFGATTYNSNSTGVFQFQAAENFTDTDQGTYASLRLTATGAASPAEVLRFGPIGQIGVGGSSYGTANQLLTSGGSSAAPSWQSGINITTLDVSGAVNFTTLTDNIAIGTSQTSGTLSLGGASQTAAVTLAPSTKSITIGIGGGATESAESKTINLGTAGVSGSTTAINIGASASGAASTTTLYGTVKVNGLTASKPVFTDASSNLTSSGTLATDQGGTGLTSYTVGDLLYYSAGTALTKLAVGTNGQILTSNGTAPVWTSGSSISVNTATNLAGGAAGSVPYQSGAGATTFLSIGTAGNIITSTGTAPQWSAPAALTKTDDTNVTLTLGGSASTALVNAASLTLGWTGQLAISRGGTNSTATPTAGGVGYGTGTAYAFTAAGTSNQVLISNGAGAPSWSNLSSLGVTSFSAGTTGFTPNTATTGAVTLAGTLATTNGGTGLTSFTANQVFYASSTSAVGQSANLCFNGTTLTAACDASISGLRVGKGAGGITTDTAVGANALAASNASSDANTAIGEYALSATTSGTRNTAVGQRAMAFNNTTGSCNVAVGTQALLCNTTGAGNIAVGYQAGYCNTTAGQITAIGTCAAYSYSTNSAITAVGALALLCSTGSLMTAVGAESYTTNTTGAQNTGIGYRAGYLNTTGSDNVAVGFASLRGNTTGLCNVAVGSNAMRVSSTGNNNTAVGTQSLYNVAADNNTAVGYQAGYSNTTGVSNIAVGFQSLLCNSTGDDNTAVGLLSLGANTTGYQNTAVGRSALDTNSTGFANTAVGYVAAQKTTGCYNTALGHSALRCNTTASNNTAVGYQSTFCNTTGGQNTAIGYQSLYKNTTGISSVAVGQFALLCNTTGSYSTAVGYEALGASTGSNNTAIGYQSAIGNTTGVNNTVIGWSAGATNTTGSQNIYVGANAGNGIAGCAHSNNVGIGFRSFYNITTGGCNVGIGTCALYSNTTASNNTAIGFEALRDNDTGSDVTAVGHFAGRVNTGSYNSFFGSYTGYSNTTGTGNAAFGGNVPGNPTFYTNSTGSCNTAIGFGALALNSTASQNTAVGYQAGYCNTTGCGLTAIGADAGRFNSTGNYNTSVGSAAAYSTCSGAENTTVGAGAFYFNTTGCSNTAIGRCAMFCNTTGSRNIAVGLATGYLLTTGNDNTYVGLGAGYTNSTSSCNTLIGRDNGSALTTGCNTFVGAGAGSDMTSGASNTILGRYSGNQDSLDIRTSSNRVIISDGAGNRQLSMYEGGTVALDSAVPVAGTGITFPATQSASSDANTLDDYEEGTWTPALTSTGTAPTGVSYSFRSGWYRKIGNMVVAGFGFSLSNKGTGATGGIKITGLPFTGANYGSYQEPTVALNSGVWNTADIAGKSYLYVPGSTAQLEGRYQNNADTVIQYSDVTDTTYMNCVIIYYL